MLGRLALSNQNVLSVHTESEAEILTSGQKSNDFDKRDTKASERSWTGMEAALRLR